MNIGSMLIVILLAGGIWISGAIFYNDWATNSGSTVTNDISSINQTYQIQSSLNNLSNTSDSKITDVPVIGNALTGIKGAIDFLNVMKSALFDAWANLISNTAGYLHMPKFWVDIFGAVVIAVILLGVIGAIIGRVLTR